MERSQTDLSKSVSGRVLRSGRRGRKQLPATELFQANHRKISARFDIETFQNAAKCVLWGYPYLLKEFNETVVPRLWEADWCRENADVADGLYEKDDVYFYAT